MKNTNEPHAGTVRVLKKVLTACLACALLLCAAACVKPKSASEQEPELPADPLLAAYTAYLSDLTKNREAILQYENDTNLKDQISRVISSRNVPTSVVIRDLDNDGIPELFYLRGTSDDAEAVLLTCKNRKVETVFSGKISENREKAYDLIKRYGAVKLALIDKSQIYYTGIGIAAEGAEEKGAASWNIGVNSAYYPILSLGDAYTVTEAGKEIVKRDALVNLFLLIGFKYVEVKAEEYEKIKAWEAETGVKVIYPMVDRESLFCPDDKDANYWYRAKKSWPVDSNNNMVQDIEKIKGIGLIDNYLRDPDNNLLDHVENKDGMYEIRVLYYTYYQYLYGHEPSPTLFFHHSAAEQNPDMPPSVLENFDRYTMIYDVAIAWLRLKLESGKAPTAETP